MSNLAAFVRLIDKPRLHQAPRVLRDRFYVARKPLRDLLNIDAFFRCYEKQYRDTPMVRHAFEMAFQLLRAFLPGGHNKIVCPKFSAAKLWISFPRRKTTFQHSRECWNVSMGGYRS